MVVNFFEIKGCTCDNVDNRPVLIAHSDANGNIDLKKMQQYCFVLLQDGRWCHFLTQQEYNLVIDGFNSNRDVSIGPENFATTTQIQNTKGIDENKTGKTAEDKLALAGIICYAASMIVSISTPIIGALTVGTIAPSDLEYGSQAQSTITYLLSMGYMAIEGISELSLLASFIIMIILRIKYKQNKVGKVLMVLHIVNAVLALIAIVLLVLACNQCMAELQSCPG